MKKIFTALLTFLMIPMIACDDSGNRTVDNPVVLPDLSNMTIQEARLLASGDFLIETTEEESVIFLPGRIIKYKSHKTGDEIEKSTSVEVVVAKKPTKGIWNFSDDDLLYVREVSWVTGPDSENWDLLNNAKAGGTDLGFPVVVDDEIIYLFGDTFANHNPVLTGLWHSNFISRSSDKVFHDGLIFSGAVTDSNGIIKPFFEGLHHADGSGNQFDYSKEVTKIPTGGIQIGDYIYIFYMSIRHWGVAGEWYVTYNQALKSHKTDLENWDLVSGLRFDEAEAPNFGQIFPFKDPESDYIFLVSIPGGRNGGAVLSRVLEKNFENKDEYEHFTDQGWIKGDSGLQIQKNNVRYILNPGVSEITVYYNEYLQKYMAVYLKGDAIIYTTASSMTDSWSKAVVITNGAKHSGLYGGLTHTSLTEYNGQKIYLLLSRWFSYNVQLLEVVLK